MMPKGKGFFLLLWILWGVVILRGYGAPSTIEPRFFPGFKYIDNYTPAIYNRLPQNCAIIQDKRGVIYAANQGGILEYDGVSWRTIEIKNNFVRSIAIDKNGTIYIGGRGEIGYLKPTDKGSLEYVSLLNKLETDDRNFSEIYQVLCTAQGVWFRTLQKLFQWENRRFRTWKTREVYWENQKNGTSFKFMFTWNNTIYIQENFIGLQKLEGHTLRPVPGGDLFLKEKIFFAVPYNRQKILIGTWSQGFYLYDGKVFTPFHTEVNDYVKEKISHGIRLQSGDFALAAGGKGLVIIDDAGRLNDIFTLASGLQDDKINNVFQDEGGNLWLALETGITKIDYTSPFSIYDKECGLKGQVLSVIHHKNRLYAGTTSGLFGIEKAPFDSTPVFLQIPYITGKCYSLISWGDSLLVGTEGGIFEVESPLSPPKPMIFKDQCLVLMRSRIDPARVWAVIKSGLLSLRQPGGKWEIEKRIKLPVVDIRSIEEDDNSTLWLGTTANGVIKVGFTGENPDPIIDIYYTNQDIPEGEAHVTRAAGQVRFLASKGLIRFDETKKNFIPDSFLGEQFCNSEKYIFRLIEDDNKHIWFHSLLKNFHAVPRPGGTYEIIDEPFRRLPNSQANAIYSDGRFTWFATGDGLIRYNHTIKKEFPPFKALIRRVKMKGGSLLYNGFDGGDNGSPKVPEIEFKNRNLTFEVGCPFFEAESKTMYAYFLEGHDDEWTSFSPGNSKDYTNLDPGRYRFRVRAKNVYDRVSDEDSFIFRVLVPWYFTWWAVTVYIAAIGFMVYFLVRWRSHTLVQEKIRLEHIVEQRTHEINHANVMLKQKNLQLEDQSEKLTEMDKIKSRFFANISHEFRTPLTLIMGPVDQIRANCKDRSLKDRIDLVYRNAKRLLGLINQLLDLSKLESGKMKLNAAPHDLVSFLKRISEPFQAAASQYELNLSFHTNDPSIVLYFDPEKMEKVVSNLLSNAFKFTPRNGSITVSAGIIHAADNDTPRQPGGTEGYARVSVKDTGIGIPSHQLPHIFERFYQADTTVEHHYQGSGIGLALVKELVELHHGTISATSQEGENSGTEFILLLPLGSLHLREEEISNNSHPEMEAEPDFSLEIPAPYKKEHNGENGEKTDPLELLHRQEAGLPPKEIILVVEDNADLRHYMRGALEPDYSVKEAGNGKEGIEIAQTIVPDLIISDIMMPETDGYELCRAVKKDIRTSHIPLILLTAKASEDNIVEGLETGADDYITKPFNTRLLQARIKNLIELRRQFQLKLNREMTFQPNRMKLSAIDTEFLKDLEKVIEKNLSEPDLNVEELSKRLYMSRTTLYRKIEALSGESPTDFIRSLRLKRAAQLLKNNFGSVTEVAFEVGFSSRAYFTKCFKEKFSCLPSEYENSQTGPDIGDIAD